MTKVNSTGHFFIKTRGRNVAVLIGKEPDSILTPREHADSVFKRAWFRLNLKRAWFSLDFKRACSFSPQEGQIQTWIGPDSVSNPREPSEKSSRRPDSILVLKWTQFSLGSIGPDPVPTSRWLDFILTIKGLIQPWLQKGACSVPTSKETDSVLTLKGSDLLHFDSRRPDKDAGRMKCSVVWLSCGLMMCHQSSLGVVFADAHRNILKWERMKKKKENDSGSNCVN